MKNQLNEGELFVNRVKLLMGYNMSKTLNENTQSIFEQIPENRYTSPETQSILDKGEKQQLQQQAQDELKKYPNWCKYPDKAVGIPKNPEGVEGDEAILVDPKTGTRFCHYPSPSNQKSGEITSVPIPENSEIVFWGIPDISRFADSLIKKYPKENKELIISNLSSILPIGTVQGFYIGETYYSGYITKPSNSSLWKFGYYRNSETKTPYTPPKWVDVRNDYQKFIDDFGFYIQLGLAAVTLFAGLFTMGTTWGVSNLLLLEIALELGVGVPIAARDFEKGRNIAGAFSIIFAYLPFMKAEKYFRGISDDVFEILSKKIGESGLNQGSKVSDFVKFYNKLSVEEQKLMTQMLRQDNFTRDEMLTKIAKGLEKEYIPKIKEMVKTIVKQKPGMFYDLKTFDKLWALDLRRNGVALAGFGLLEIFLGDKWNEEEKNKLKNIYIHIPDSLKKEFTLNLIESGEKANSVISHVEDKINHEYVNEITSDSIEDSFKEVNAPYKKLN